MADGTALSIAFIEKRPLAAGRVLASMNPGDAAAFLEATPARVAARAFSAMSAWDAAALLARMSTVAAGAALRELHYREATGILRLTGASARPPILDELPARLRRSFEISLSFPDDTVGAHMSTIVLTLAPEQTVAEAIGQVRRVREAAADSVFVVDAGKRLAGLVAVAALLRHPEHVSLDDIMDSTITPLSARARLATVADHPLWDDYLELPVASRQREVIGALSRRSARQAVDAEHRSTAAAASSAMAAPLGSAFAATAAGVARLWLGSGEQRARSGRADESR